MSSVLPLLRRLMDSFLGAALGGAVYGLWAWWVNRHSAQAIPIGIGHWATSVFLTYTSTRVMHWVWRHSRSGGLVVGLGLLYTYVCLIGLHLFLGTPHLFYTLALGILPNGFFCTTYSALLARTDRPDAATVC